MVVLMATIYWALDRILLSPWGRVLRAIREDETAAIALGKSARRFRLEAFVLGSTLMGLAGALYVSFIGFVSPFDFLPILTFQVWAMLIVAAAETTARLAGALVVWAIWAGSGVAVSKLVPPSRAAQGAAIQVILIGLLLMLVLLFRPRGLIGEAAVSRGTWTIEKLVSPELVLSVRPPPDRTGGGCLAARERLSSPWRRRALSLPLNGGRTMERTGRSAVVLAAALLAGRCPLRPRPPRAAR